MTNRSDLTMTQKLRALAGLGFGAPGAGESQTAFETLAAQTLGGATPSELVLDLEDPNQRRLGDYELIEMIGQGGMGVVYRARQVSLDRDVAVKLLAVGPWASADFVDRFRHEARNAARMQHPSIVAIHEIGQDEDLSFFSMQFVTGPTLEQVLKARGPMGSSESAQLLRKLAEAVDYAHRLNVLHLDLKPGNILLDGQDGRPFIADFGLSRPLDHALASDQTEVSGTPSFMAPEQAQLHSHRLSPATDIHGLGAIFYSALTGRPPYLGSSAEDTVRQVIERAPARLREINPEVPRDLEAICMKCLAKDPAERYPSAHELADDLMRFLDGRPVSVRAPSLWERLVRWYRDEPVTFGGVAGSFLLLASVVIGLGVAWFERESLILQRDLSVAMLGSSIEAQPDGSNELLGAALDELYSDSHRVYAGDRERRRVLVGLANELQVRGAEKKADSVRLHAGLFSVRENFDEWISALRSRNSSYGHLAAGYLIMAHAEGPDWNKQSANAHLQRAADAGWNDPALLAAIVRACDGLPCQEGLSARIAELQPKNLFGLWASWTFRTNEMPAELMGLWEGALTASDAVFRDLSSQSFSGVREEILAAAKILDSTEIELPVPAVEVAELLMAVPIYLVHFTWRAYPLNLVLHCEQNRDNREIRTKCLRLADAMAASEVLSSRLYARDVLAPIAQTADEKQQLELLRQEAEELGFVSFPYHCVAGGPPDGTPVDSQWECTPPRPLLDQGRISRFVDDLIQEGQIQALINCALETSCFQYYRW